MCTTTGNAISLENHVAAILRAEFAFSSKLFVVWKEILCGGRPRGIAFFGRNFSNIIIIVVVVIIIDVVVVTIVILILIISIIISSSSRAPIYCTFQNVKRNTIFRFWLTLISANQD